MIDITAKLSPWLQAPSWCIALSGGLDSTVLLHLLVHAAQQQALPPIRAIHIHHGLQSAADSWPAHCQRLCDVLGVNLQVVAVKVAPGASLEQGARDARYAAFAQCLQQGEVLLTGQHREDQAETLLFRLLRGAGVRGLTGMPQVRGLGQGVLVRPLLDVPRQVLEAYAREQRLQWVEDPSNSDTRYSRNYLRHAVFPVLQQRWPQVAQNLARSAQHLGEAQGLLDELAAQDLALASTPSGIDWLALASLDLTVLRALSPARQRNVLQYWLATRTRLPDARHWAGWENLRDAAGDGQPSWQLTDGELHRSNDRIWWLTDDWLKAPQAQCWGCPDQALELTGNGSVRLSGSLPQGPLRIAYRRGGEALQVEGRGRRDLKRLLNELQVPLFVRSRLPLLYRGDQLLAVANLPSLSQGAWQLHWCVPTSEQGLR
ncbi:tRNA lysidine(34) synthetase TilS [Pseudomonas sp. GD03860]|uniref:tRNA lysidine(34) synthetase TilS n=1 Tax=Pseudomonas TaxID=286 RepID=UPI002363C7B0|nr:MULTISPECIES: tRNA lysidine(34) synthetase TilS [Pseudomonas]MDD2060327.1 tRNA lysidine(34) synthetase TilS [Pseudomonas putida]MDH0635460.1 tRNA lysidine(34) synthetase TilS [Pseudomonas sp. GD03860]